MSSVIELNIYDHLMDTTDGDTSNATRQTARDNFRHKVGPNVFLGRFPDSAGSPAVYLRRIDGGEQYTVAAEHNRSQPVVEFVITAKEHDGRDMLDVADYLRLIFSGYRGGMGDMTCYGCTVERSIGGLPVPWVDGVSWVHSYSISFLFTVDVTVAA